MAKKQKTKTKTKSAAAAVANDSFDGVYLLKMVLYLLLGSIWIKISNSADASIPVPIGLVAGLLFTMHEHFRIDRKMEYVVLLAAMLFGYFAPYGLYISF